MARIETDESGNVWSIDDSTGVHELIHDETGNARAQLLTFAKERADAFEAFTKEFLS